MIDSTKLRAVPTLYPSPNWVIAQVYNQNYENTCTQIQEIFGDVSPIRATVVPHWITTDYRNGTEVILIEPIFPGYVFVDLAAPCVNWTALDETGSMLRILTESNIHQKKPYRLTTEEVIHVIDLTTDSLQLISPATYELLGYEVVITEGLFRDFSGVVVEDGNTVKVELKHESRVLQVRIDRDKVAKKTV